jgi:DNA mismatch repair protein MutL
MSDVIKLLPDHIANQIAAGEVIQRPASVLKELVENSIDADASKVDILIKDAGKTLIQIIDNGKGMSAYDTRMCFERHATSKVSKAEDLFALTTKGFRGEALASIAAIAHVTLKSKQREQEIGHTITIEGSKVTADEPIVFSNGTSFEIKNLFFNVPARRNFLKSENVELKHLTDEFERIALAHPEVSFTLKHNNSELYNLPAAVLKKRVVDLLGKNASEKIVPINEYTDIVEIVGFVGKPEFAKKTRGEQFFFVNDRFFKDTYFNHAVTRAFEGLIQPKTFPTYFLYLKVNPEKIDVNVHPTKTEIKFEEDRLIYSIILSSVKQALGKYNIAPSLDFEQETSFDIPLSMRNNIPVEPVIKVNENYNPFQTTSKTSSGTTKSGYSSAMKATGFGNSEITQQDWDNFYQIETEDDEKESPAISLDFSTDENPLTSLSKQFLVKGNLLYFTNEAGLLSVHYKRAFERVLYDQMMQAFVLNPIHSQTLLFPIERELSKNEASGWNDNLDMLSRLGFSSEIKDQNLLLSGIPTLLQEDSFQVCLDEILSTMDYQTIEKGDIAHFLIHTIAKAAAKKKQITPNDQGVLDLMHDLYESSDKNYSPSGKKILNLIPFIEIENQF